MRLLARLFILSLLIALLTPVASAQFFFGGSGQGGSSTQGSNSINQRTYYTEGMIGEAIIEADRDSRSLIIIADEETNEHIRQIIKNLDRPVQQVLIKVVFVEVTYRDDVDFGIEGTLSLENGEHNFETVFGLAAESAGGFYRILEGDLSVTMRAIAEVGKLEVLSRPSVLTRNNQEAVITVGSEVPFITESRTTDEGQTINTVEYDDIGIILRVTPFITKDGLVEMILAPEISTLTDETVPISETLDAPVFAKRSADTVVVTPNGQTVVIGGLMEDNRTEVVNKVPILGDIPLLGYAFRRTTKENTKTELLIFLTPYVVEGPEQLVDMSESESSRSELIPKAFDQVKMSKYVNPDNVTSEVENQAHNRVQEEAGTPAASEAVKPAPDGAETSPAPQESAAGEPVREPVKRIGRHRAR